jgi:apolipoprotein N-acyltransferase
MSRFAAFAAAVSAAALLFLAMPGITGWWPLLFVALVPLLSALRRLSARRSLCMGMLCGLIYNIGLLYWIVPVLRRFGGQHVLISACALLLLAAYMAVYVGLFCLLLNLMISRSGPEGDSTAVALLTAPVLWVGLDVVRGHLLTGMPWMDLGYGLYRQPLLIQAADLGGHHLITFCIVMINALLFWLIDRIRTPDAPPSRHHYGQAVIVLLGLCCVGVYSVLRYQQVASEMTATEKAAVVAVQGNISQSEKWSPDVKAKTIDQYLALSRASVTKMNRTDLLIWPETALPFYPPREPLMNRIRDFVREKRVHLLTGSPYFTVTPKRKKPVAYYNSALLFNPSGRLEARYNKQHLVPFGEYIPLRTYLWFLKPLVELIGDFTPGDSFEPLEADRIKAGVLICFESIFPEIARRETMAGANLLVNLTNDAWYGRSSAPYHSWAMTVMRAVENRRSLVRAANTGISGFVEPTGIIRKQSSLFTAEAVTADVELTTMQTIFTCGGHLFGTVCLALILPLLYLSVLKQRKLRKRR